MSEEFEESEVIFEQNSDEEANDYKRVVQKNAKTREMRSKSRSKRKKRNNNNNNNNNNNSVPVDIPENGSGNRWFQYVESDYLFEDDEYDDSGVVVPPHVIIGRRMAGKMAYSVCIGNGRTLKGRDLSEMRNSVLRMTGFLEA